MCLMIFIKTVAEYSKLKHKGMGDTEGSVRCRPCRIKHKFAFYLPIATGKVLDKSEYSTLQGQEEEESFTKGNVTNACVPDVL